MSTRTSETKRQRKKRRAAARRAAPAPPHNSPKTDIVGALIGNAIVLGVLVYAVVLANHYLEFFRQSVTEDGYLEWMTFWSFFLAAPLLFLAARAQRRLTGRLSWFLCGVGLFCFLVAMEEISWGQRILNPMNQNLKIKSSNNLVKNASGCPHGCRNSRRQPVLPT